MRSIEKSRFASYLNQRTNTNTHKRIRCNICKDTEVIESVIILIRIIKIQLTFLWGVLKFLFSTKIKNKTKLGLLSICVSCTTYHSVHNTDPLKYLLFTRQK